ncbi:unnamed protein product [Phytomonas sp. EM1]|nr:unnamed protein product [Phytomonas sp. EM1]|eukprot:CCW62449.1 unnamed protein product [Phytomonas sp. isolate EM1]
MLYNALGKALMLKNLYLYTQYHGLLRFGIEFTSIFLFSTLFASLCRLLLRTDSDYFISFWGLGNLTYE